MIQSIHIAIFLPLPYRITFDLENTRCNYERDGEAEAVIRFIETACKTTLATIPSWSEVSRFLRYSLEHSDNVKKEFLASVVTEESGQLFFYIAEDDSSIVWIDESKLDAWDVTREDNYLPSGH